jgi:hypothetical protein
MAGEDAAAARRPPKEEEEEEDDDDLDNVPLALSRAKKPGNASASKVKKEEEDDDDDLDNVPLALSRAKKVCLPLPQISAFRSVAWRASQCE